MAAWAKPPRRTPKAVTRVAAARSASSSPRGAKASMTAMMHTLRISGLAAGSEKRPWQLSTLWNSAARETNPM